MKFQLKYFTQDSLIRSSVVEKAVILTILVLTHTNILICNSADAEENNNFGALSNDDIENSVGYGEDCSSEGPFCDVRQHLSCDNVEEVCICDDKNGYVHVGHLEMIPTLFEDETEDNKGKKICMKETDLEYKLNRLSNITKKIRDFAEIMKKYQKYLPKKYQDLLKDEVTKYFTYIQINHLLTILIIYYNFYSSRVSHPLPIKLFKLAMSSSTACAVLIPIIAAKKNESWRT